MYEVKSTGNMDRVSLGNENSAEPKRSPEIPRLLGEIARELEYAEARLGGLEKRCVPAMRGVNLSEEKNGSNGPSIHSELGSSLDGFLLRIRLLGQTISNIEARLEL